MKKTDNLTSKRVLVTGATGFVGRHLIPLLLREKYSVTVTTRDKKKAASFPWHKNVECIQLDLNDETSALQIDNFSSVIHLAWEGLPKYESEFHIKKNLPNNYNFLHQIIRRGVNHILISGSCSEYGMQSGQIKSSAPCYPITRYAFAKNALHNQLRELQQHYNFRLQWARLFYMFGQGQNKNSIIPQLDKAIDTGKEIFNMSEGNQLRDYLPVEEVAEQLLYLFEKKLDGAFNICSGQPISVKKLVENHISKRKSSIKINLGYYPYLDHEPMEFWGKKDISFLEK